MAANSTETLFSSTHSSRAACARDGRKPMRRHFSRWALPGCRCLHIWLRWAHTELGISIHMSLDCGCVPHDGSVILFTKKFDPREHHPDHTRRYQHAETSRRTYNYAQQEHLPAVCVEHGGYMRDVPPPPANGNLLQTSANPTLCHDRVHMRA